VDREPFDPEWSGGSWYGTGSGTYWTLNPKEYADPRKHGPEYQARGRRRPPADGSGRNGGAADQTAAPATEPPAPAEATWSDATATDAGEPTWTARPRVHASEGRSSSAATDRADPPPDGLSILVRLLDPPHPPPERALLALLGWPPLGLAVATLVGEATGCGRFAAICTDSAATTATAGILLSQFAILAVLAALPRVASLAVGGTLAMIVVALPAAIILTAAGGSREPGVAGRVLIEVMAVAWVVGVGLAIRRSRAGSPETPRTLPP